MKLTYITQTCPPEPGATSRPLRQAVLLKRLGHDVTLITAFPSYPHGRVHHDYRGRLWARECVDDVQIIRVRSFSTPNHGVVRRLLSYLSFAIAALLAALFARRPDAVIASVPAPFTDLSGWLAARMKSAIFIIELRDLLPDNLQVAGFEKTGMGYRLLDRYYGWMYRRADIFALAYERMAEKLRQRGIRTEYLLNLPHGMDFDEPRQDLRDLTRAKLGLDDQFVVTYAGSFSPYYRVPAFLRAAELLQRRLPKARMLLIGTGPDSQSVMQAVYKRGVHNVALTGGLHPDAVFAYLQASDAFLHPQILPEILNGTKIVEYLAAGKPILNICHNSLYDGQAESHGIGRSVAADDAEALAAAVIFYAENPEIAVETGEISRALAESMFDRDSIVTKFSNELEDSLKRIRGCGNEESNYLRL